jgi:cation diffusion facilitator CzcD-associated flavoprotein CzcO
MAEQELDVAIIGAGFAGIGAAIKLREAGFYNLRIFEKTDGISGTWHDNTYPGAACDVPSHLYCYSFAPNPDWSRIYSPQPEIKAYAEKVVADHDLLPLIDFGTEIKTAVFDPKSARWTLTTADGQRIIARFVVWSVAFLGTPQIPAFKDLSSFKGEMFHSARWDHSVDLRDKNVVIVGSAASALQIGPKIAPKVKHLTMFQRTANYVMQRDDRAYGAKEKKLFRKFPALHALLRWFLFNRQDRFFFHGMRPGSLVNRMMQKRSLDHLEDKIKDPELRKKLTPNYIWGCKRLLISDDFYDMFLRENVTLETDGIDHFTKDGIVTGAGDLVDADVVVMATGFTATQFMPGIEISGEGGATLAKWRDDLRALKGLTVAGFPNSFFMLGPNTGLGHSSMILMIESQLRYLVEVMTSLQAGETVQPTEDAIASYNEQIQADLAACIWATSCQSWYKREDGFIPTMWPHSTGAYDKMMSHVDWSELLITASPAANHPTPHHKG